LAAAVSGSVAPSGDVIPKFAVDKKLTDKGKVNRMELAEALVEALVEEYLAAVWELERDSVIKNGTRIWRTLYASWRTSR